MPSEFLEIKTPTGRFVTYTLMPGSYVRMHAPGDKGWREQRRDEILHEEHVAERASLCVDGVGFFRDRRSFVKKLKAEGAELVSRVTL